MDTHDSKHFTPALHDTAERGMDLGMVLADTHYGSEANVNHAANRDGDGGKASGGRVELIGPVMTANSAKQGDLTLEQFTFY